MYIDNYKTIVMEQNPAGSPGNLGDSCAESSRVATLKFVLKQDSGINLTVFITDNGIIRHPDSPWRENDTSGDQVYPLIAAASLSQPELAKTIVQKLSDAGNKTGNGDRLSPGMYGQIYRAQNKPNLWISDLPVLAQALIFKLPYRWSDSKKTLEKTSGSSGDYLNFVNALAFAKAKNNITWPMKLAMKLINKELVLQKVKDYYQIEPNSKWLIDLYTEALGIIYV